MKKITTLIFTFLFILIFGGCGKSLYPDLPQNAVAFETGSFIDINDDDAGYITIEYNGRTYMPYGTLGKTIHSKDIDECIGYIVREYGDKDTRLFTLVGDDEQNYLMMHYVATTLMNQPNFLRAVDTKDKNIKTPDFINDLEYNFWK